MSNAINWDAVASHLNYSTETEMWKDFYLTQKLSIAALEKKLGVTRPTIRAALLRCGLSLRGRGGPHRVKIRISDEQLLKEVNETGPRNVAYHYEVSMTCITNRIRQAKERLASSKTQAEKKEIE